MFSHDVEVAVRLSHESRRPIGHHTAYDIAKTLKDELWAREAGVPSALRVFVESGHFEVSTLHSACGEASDDLGINSAAAPKAARIVHALQRYADYHQDSTGKRGPVDGWAELTGQKVSR